MENFEAARNVCHIFLNPIRQQRKVTWDDIVQVVQNPLLKQQYPDVDMDELAVQLEADFGIFSGQTTELTEKEVRPWLKDAKAGILWPLWKRYSSWLRIGDASFPVNDLDDVTDRILDKCVNPKTPGNWDRRGMVVGHVQSGKTANYSGLINKATDAGYKLIIIIAGVHNTLRAQTQIRVDEGYIGRKSTTYLRNKKTEPVGVGAYPCETQIYSYTSAENNGDFKRSVATQLNVPIGGQSPTVLVIKKNTRILENLILWLNTFAQEDEKGDRKIRNVPLLVIDDEADNASVNSGTEAEIKSVNRLIRTLLNLFCQNTFIGYTATPYANLFIPSSWDVDRSTSIEGHTFKIGEDLFPRDFIINLSAPSNYIGAARVFGFVNDQTEEETEGLDIIRPAEDQEPLIPKSIGKKNADDLPDDIPLSLRKAMLSFILAGAIRRLRKQGHKHHSMLVHAVSRVKWIDRLAWLVNDTLTDIRLQISSEQGTVIHELESLYHTDFEPTTQEVLENLGYHDPRIKSFSWEDIRKELHAAVTKIEVRAVHGTKNTRGLEYHEIRELDYKQYEDAGNSLWVIAVGGNKLSRGITLEGLCTSYYLRTVRLYDSLMQMGRWFGYRPGYADLCRLYTTSELVGWYRHVTMATEEMRADFDQMAAANMRPADFQLKVRTHPGMLMITSISKMRGHEKIRTGFSGRLVQTYAFKTVQTVVNNNYAAFCSLLNQAGKPETLYSGKSKLMNGLIWKQSDVSLVIDFLSRIDSPYIRTDIVRPYIELQASNGLFRKWNIAVILNSSEKVGISEGQLKGEDVLKMEIPVAGTPILAGLPTRNLELAFNQAELSVKGGKNAILDKRARMIDLDLPGNAAEEKIKQARNESGMPLLVIMPLDPRVHVTLGQDVPLIGYGLMFPEVPGESTYEYAARPLNEEFENDPHEDDDEDTEE